MPNLKFDNLKRCPGMSINFLEWPISVHYFKKSGNSASGCANDFRNRLESVPQRNERNRLRLVESKFSPRGWCSMHDIYLKKSKMCYNDIHRSNDEI